MVHLEGGEQRGRARLVTLEAAATFAQHGVDGLVDVDVVAMPNGHPEYDVESIAARCVSSRQASDCLQKPSLWEGEAMAMQQGTYPVQFSVDYPDRPLNRLTTAFRLVVAIPILIVLGTVSGSTWVRVYSRGSSYMVAGAGGLLFAGPLLMILFRQKYPRWWFDWNLELQRFTNRVWAYLALMDDRYPSTDQQQAVHLDYVYPDAAHDLNRWLPLVKWLLAIPHYVVLIFLWVAAIVVVLIAWFAILFTGRYPSGMFDFVQGVLRWGNRVLGYAFVLVTDKYPPFRLSP